MYQCLCEKKTKKVKNKNKIYKMTFFDKNFFIAMGIIYIKLMMIIFIYTDTQDITKIQLFE